MIICPKCKREVPDGTQYCPFCAEELNSAAHPAVNIPEPQDDIDESDCKLYPVTKVIGWIIIVAGIIASIIIGDEFEIHYSFNWSLFFAVATSSVVFGTLFLCIERHFFNQERIIEQLEKIANKK